MNDSLTMFAARRHHCQSFKWHVNGDVAQVTWCFRNLYFFSNSRQYNPAYVDGNCGNCYAVKSGRGIPKRNEFANIKPKVASKAYQVIFIPPLCILIPLHLCILLEASSHPGTMGQICLSCSLLITFDPWTFFRSMYTFVYLSPSSRIHIWSCTLFIPFHSNTKLNILRSPNTDTIHRFNLYIPDHLSIHNNSGMFSFTFNTSRALCQT